MGCRVHRADGRHRGIRAGEGTRLVHIDFEPIQVGSGIHGGLIDIGNRRFPTQRPRGKWGSGSDGRRGSGFGGGASTTTTGEGCQCDDQRKKHGPSDSGRQKEPSLEPKRSQQACHDRALTLSTSYAIITRPWISIMKSGFRYCNTSAAPEEKNKGCRPKGRQPGVIHDLYIHSR